MWEARYLYYINNTTLVLIGHRANSNTPSRTKDPIRLLYVCLLRDTTQPALSTVREPPPGMDSV